MSLGKNIEENNYRARADRRLMQGRVVSRHDAVKTCTIDVGTSDVLGNSVYMENVPFQAQAPPQVGDTVTLAYANSSPYSLSVGSSQVGGANPGGVVQNGGVMSIHTGTSPKVRDDIILAAGDGSINIVESGHTFSFNAVGATNPPQPINSISTAGSSVKFAREDHVHIGLHSINGGGTPLSGDVTIAAGTNVTVAQSGSTITISASGGGGGGGSGVTSLNSLTGALSLVAGTNVTLSVSGSSVTINSSGSGGTVRPAVRVALDYQTTVLYEDTDSEEVYLVLTAAATYTLNLQFGATIVPTNNTDSPGTTTRQVFHVLNASSIAVTVSNVSSNVTFKNIGSSIAVGVSVTYVCVRTGVNTYDAYQF